MDCLVIINQSKKKTEGMCPYKLKPENIYPREAVASITIPGLLKSF
jgi:hypothetical protein